MTQELKIGDFIWHPCSMDIIQHKITSIRQYEGYNHYVLKAVNNVGACGKIEVIVDEHKGKFRFVELLDEEEHPTASGLQDFIEGNYYTTLNEARLEFYQQQFWLASANMDERERLFKESKKRFEQVELLVKELKSLIKQ